MHKTDVGTSRYNSFLWEKGKKFKKTPFMLDRLLSPKLTLDNILWFGAMFFIARSSLLMGEVAPFGFIFWAVALRFFPAKKTLFTASALIGWFTAPVGTFPPWFFPASMILWKGLDFLYVKILHKDGAPFVFLPVVILLLRVPLLYVQGFVFYETVIVVLEAVLAGLFPLMLLPFFREVNVKSTISPSAEVVVGVVLTLFLVFLGINDIVFYTVSFVNIIPPLIILLGAYLLGPLWGTLCGVITGLTISFADPQLFPYAGALGITGMVAGALRNYNRVFTAAGYLVVLRFLAFFASEGGYTFTTIQEDIITAAVFLALPSSLYERLREWSSFLPFKEDGEEKLRFAMASRVKEFASIFKELAATFRPLEEGEEIRSKRDLSPLMDYFSRRVCGSCKQFDRCWRSDFYNQYRRVVSMLSYVDEKETFSEKMIPVKLRRFCPRQREIVKTIGSMKEIYNLNCYWQEKIKEGRFLVSHQLEGMSSVMHDLAQELKLETAEESKEERALNRFALELGIAQVAREGHSITGDSYTILELENGGQAVVLSDGMGNGKEARNASQSTVKLMEHLLKTGLRQDVTINTINTLLRLRYPSERFTTLDLALLNLQSGEIHLHKLGSPPSYLKKKTNVRVIGSGSLPMGILEDVVPEKEYITINEKCTLVMITDGILEVPGNGENEDDEWIVQALSEIRHDHPQIIADRLIEEACYRWPKGVQDDLTVLVGSIKPVV